MIHDLVIIKDGLPLLVKNFTESQKAFCKGDSLILISGFFSALNSFSDSFEDLGTISELKLSNNKLKLSFLKESSMPNLIYLATYDEGSKAVNVLRVLRKVSRTFLKKYNINQILNWNGRLDEFESFETILERAQEEEKQETDSEFKDKVYELFKKVEQTLNEESRFENKSIDCQENLQNLPEYCYKVPKFKVKMNVNPRHYLTGETSHKVFQCIDGKKQINAIATDLDITHEEVYNICKNLIKLGFINLN